MWFISRNKVSTAVIPAKAGTSLQCINGILPLFYKSNGWKPLILCNGRMPLLHCFFFVCLFLSVITFNIQAVQPDGLDKVVRLTKNKGTIYELLKDLSEQSGFLFIYDSQIIENDKTVKVAKKTCSLREAIRLITGNDQLQMDVSGDYLLLRLTPSPRIETTENKIDIMSLQDVHFTIRGVVHDRHTGEPIMYASVQILNTSIGTVTNQDGGFRLLIPDSLLHDKVKIAHIGYESQEIELTPLKDRFIRLSLQPQVISLQEVVVNSVNPVQVLTDMLNNRATNYTSEPSYHTTFYREGINLNDRNIDLIESVLRVYKTGYQKKTYEDQVKLIKKRRIVSRIEIDTIYPKMRSGISSCLILDVIKELPDFLVPAEETSYTYAYQGKSSIGNQPVHVIYFQQKDHIREPLYTGELFIVEDNKALVEVRFEVNPRLANKATHMFVAKKPFGLSMNLMQAKYKVSYVPSKHGTYYTNHVRGDVFFKIHRKNRFLTSTLHFWFEMVTCDVDMKNVKPFPLHERLSAKKIFAETIAVYDKRFWERFNIILPEESLQNRLIHNLNEILIPE